MGISNEPNGLKPTTSGKLVLKIKETRFIMGKYFFLNSYSKNRLISKLVLSWFIYAVYNRKESKQLL